MRAARQPVNRCPAFRPRRSASALGRTFISTEVSNGYLAAMSSSSRPGWYPDPAGSEGLRWWDGVEWTDDLRGAPAPPESLPVASAAFHAAGDEGRASTPEHPERPEIVTAREVGGASDVPAWQQTEWWLLHRWAAAALGAGLLVMFASRSADAGHSWSPGSVLDHLVNPVLVTALLLVALALVSWPVMRFVLRKRDWPFRRLFWSKGVMGATLVFLAIAVSGAGKG